MPLTAGSIKKYSERSQVGLARILFFCPLILAFAGCAPSPHDTAARGDVELLAQMLDQDPAIITSLNKMRKTPLHYAVTYGKEDSINLLLARGADVNAADITGYRPLHCAAVLDRTPEADLLLAAGADIAAQDKFGDTPLHIAAMHGRVGMIDFLIGRGADAAAKNTAGLTPYDLAVQQRKPDAATRLQPAAATGN